MEHVLDSAAIVLIILLIAYVLAKMIIKAYFAAKLQYINHMIEKAKELTKHGKAH
jgi:hypothetical protein